MLLAEDNLAPLNLVAEGLQDFLQVQSFGKPWKAGGKSCSQPSINPEFDHEP